MVAAVTVAAVRGVALDRGSAPGRGVAQYALGPVHCISHAALL